MRNDTMTFEPNLDASPALFDMGREALAAARKAFDGQAFFVSARRLQKDGTWLGPPSATLSLAEESALAALGGIETAQELGANGLLCDVPGSVVEQAMSLGMRCLAHLPYAAGEPVDVRRARLDQLCELVQRIPGLDSVLPAPVGEAQGLDTLQFFAACRLACPGLHVVVDVELLGPKLGQLCLSFGADELLGAIMGQRALRLGAHASSNALTRDEAALLLRASGFTPCERMPEGKAQVL
jgi:hypothetical protein